METVLRKQPHENIRMKKSRHRLRQVSKPAARPTTCTLHVDDLSRAGNGVAKEPAGRVVFIPFTAPGDVVTARITSQKSQYAQAELVEILQPSEQRQAPKCAVFGRCGGCAWQHIAYPLQWQTKSLGVKQALSRMKVPIPAAWEEYPAAQIWSYRNRIQLRGNKDRVGLYAKTSHSIVPIERCEIAREELNRHIGAVREQGKRLAQPYKVELELLHDGTVRTTWNSVTAAAGFQQINSEQNSHLKQWVLEHICKHQPVLDLYGGSANLSAQLAPLSPHIDCVDVVVPDNETVKWPDNMSFHRSDVFSWVVNKAKLQRKNTPVAPSCSAIIDPPRGGMPEHLGEFIDGLQRLNVTELISVGCKTDTWVRDLAGFIQQGWQLENVAVFDFFPQTAHVESAGLLRRIKT